MNLVFQVVYELLMWLSAVTGLSYQEVNIIVYYFLIPLIFLALVDRIFRMWICSLLFLCASAITLLLIPDFEQFSRALFDLSVVFLHQFSAVGWNYTEASVWVCVIGPGLTLLFLGYIASRRRRSQRQRHSAGSET